MNQEAIFIPNLEGKDLNAYEKKRNQFKHLLGNRVGIAIYYLKSADIPESPERINEIANSGLTNEELVAMLAVNGYQSQYNPELTGNSSLRMQAIKASNINIDI